MTTFNTASEDLTLKESSAEKNLKPPSRTRQISVENTETLSRTSNPKKVNTTTKKQKVAYLSSNDSGQILAKSKNDKSPVSTLHDTTLYGGETELKKGQGKKDIKSKNDLKLTIPL